VQQNIFDERLTVWIIIFPAASRLVSQLSTAVSNDSLDKCLADLYCHHLLLLQLDKVQPCI
jgi:hypothetical protein